MTNNGRPAPEALLFVASGLSFCSANFRKERPGYGWNRHFTQQQSPSCDVAVHRVPGITVLAERCTLQRKPRERAFGTGVGQDLCIQLPIRTGLGMPFSFWKIITTSTASTPICRPQLPPEIVMNAGALQPSAVRQVATPLPSLAPKIKPPLTMCGITATHFACSNTSSGIPLSGIPIISCITLVELFSRSVASSRADPAQLNVPRLNIASTNITFFMGQPPFLLPQRALSGVVLCAHPHTSLGRHQGAHQDQFEASKSELKRSEQ